MHFSQESKENTYDKCILGWQGVYWTIWSMKGVLTTDPWCNVYYNSHFTNKVDAVVGRMGKGQHIQLYSSNVHKSWTKSNVHAEAPVCLSNDFIPHHETERPSGYCSQSRVTRKSLLVLCVRSSLIPRSSHTSVHHLLWLTWYCKWQTQRWDGHCYW